MENPMMDLMKAFNDKAMQSAKRVGELNMKTFEQLTEKQSQLVNSCFESGSKTFEAITKAKDPKEVITLQQEIVKSCNEKWMSNIREAIDMLSSTREELMAIAEEAAKNASESTEKMTELSKKSMTENMEKAQAAVEQAMSKASEMAQNATKAGKSKVA